MIKSTYTEEGQAIIDQVKIQDEIQENLRLYRADQVIKEAKRLALAARVQRMLGGKS